jgi:hypothetical protein
MRAGSSSRGWAWPLAAGAQQTPIHRIGLLTSAAERDSQQQLRLLRIRHTIDQAPIDA